MSAKAETIQGSNLGYFNIRQQYYFVE